MKNETHIANITQPGVLIYHDWIRKWGELFEHHMPVEKPWKLGRRVNGFTLAPGQEWHRSNVKSDRPTRFPGPEWRLTLVGEFIQNGDKFFDGKWIDVCTRKLPGPAYDDAYYITRRPLPVPPPNSRPRTRRGR